MKWMIIAALVCLLSTLRFVQKRGNAHRSQTIHMIGTENGDRRESSSADLSASPNPIAFHGSFVVGAICKDGIILASDSRGNIFDKSDNRQKALAYFDSIQKIFPIGSNAIAETGQGLILNVFFSAIVDNFLKQHADRPVDQLLPAFIHYCQLTLPPEGVAEVKKQILFSAGFINDSPVICYFNEKQQGGAFGCIQRNGFVESAPTLLGVYEKKLSLLSAKGTAALIRRAIQEYAKEGDRWETIGGPISILGITKSGVRWIDGEPPKQRWTSIQDFIREYRQGTLRLRLIPPATEKQLENLFETVPGVD